MTPSQYRAAHSDVVLSPSSASGFFQIDERTTRPWVASDGGKEVAHAVAITLRLIQRCKLKPSDGTAVMIEAEVAQ